MKRSEMLEDIALELIREELGFPSYDKCQIVAEYVLNRIEKEGMSHEWEPETSESEICDD